MVIGVRILAFIIDIAFCFGTLPLIMQGVGWLITKTGIFGMVLIPFWFFAFLICPFLYLAIPTAIWGKTFGKLLCRLKVVDFRGEAPGIWRGLGREVLKCLAVCSGIGAMLTLFQIIYQGGTWYDHMCDTQVEFDPYVRLTKTQKNWRKLYKNKISPSRRF